MTNEQIQALKAAAENLATAEERYDRAEITIREYISVNDQYHNFVKDPANILSLLAERDADKALIAEQEKRIAELEARALLAAHEQEPVAYMCDGDDWREYNGHNEFSCGGPGIPLYTHPAPVPAVPDERTWLFYCEKYPEMPMGDAIIRAVEWNACRAAMLNGGKS
nr:MAG TPA: hypothetical protein [Caudoviricetes sp.]